MIIKQREERHRADQAILRIQGVYEQYKIKADKLCHCFDVVRLQCDLLYKGMHWTHWKQTYVYSGQCFEVEKV